MQPDASRPDILVLGGDGMLGHKIFQHLRASAATACTVRGDLPPRVDLLAGADVIHGVDLIDLDRAAELLADSRQEAFGLEDERLQDHKQLIDTRKDRAGFRTVRTRRVLLRRRIARRHGKAQGRMAG